MTETDTPSQRGAFAAFLLVAMVIGLGTIAFGFLLAGESVLAAAWIGGIGLGLFLASGVLTSWAGDLLGVDWQNRRRIAVACLALSVLLLVSFLVLNSVEFSSRETSNLL